MVFVAVASSSSSYNNGPRELVDDCLAFTQVEKEDTRKTVKRLRCRFHLLELECRRLYWIKDVIDKWIRQYRKRLCECDK